MRTEAARTAWVAGFAVSLSLVLASDLSGQTPSETPDSLTGHGERSSSEPLLALSDAEVRARVKLISQQVMCACPDENWTRTLASCLDGCADPQKNQILDLVQSGSSDEEVVTFMVANYGPQVRSNPGWAGAAKGVFILPLIALIAGGAFAGYVILGWQKAGAEARSERRRLQTEITPEEISRIERDLDSIE